MSGPNGHTPKGDPNLKFYHHPYSATFYGAIDENHVRVEAENGEWGEFTRNGEWLAGPMRSCDPIFARWVGGELLLKRASKGRTQ